jgi:hypothetical protein
MKVCPGVEVEPGRGEERNEADYSSPITALDRDRQLIDPRLAFLLRAAARYDLVECGLLDLEAAFDFEFVETFLEITAACTCQRAIHRHFDREHRRICEEQLRRWWRLSQPRGFIGQAL